MNFQRVARLYEVVFTIFSLVLITVTVHLTLSFQTSPQVFYVLIVVWTLFISIILLTLYRKDIEIDTRLHIVRFAYLSATLVTELRIVIASIMRCRMRDEIEEKKVQGFRTILNLAHEYYSFIKNEYCTANIAIITESNGERVCKIIQYDDFVPNVRREREADIPLEKSLFGEILRRDLRAITIDDYTLNKYPIYLTPIIEEGYCLSGICVPVKVFDNAIGFFNVDSMKRNIFKPSEDERIASFFAELVGQVAQTIEYKSKEFN